MNLLKKAGVTLTSVLAALGFTPRRKAGVITVTFADGTQEEFVPSANTDAARGLALESAMAVSVAGCTIDLSPGNYYVAKVPATVAGIVSQFLILDKMTIRLNGARLYKKSTDTASCMFCANATTGVDDWSIIGPGVLEGSYALTADTAARGTASAEIGVQMWASRRWRVDAVTIVNMAGTNLQANSASFSADEYGSGYKSSTGHVSNCNLDLGNIGFANYAGNENVTLTNCTLNANLTAADIYAGNTKFIGCDAIKNTNYVLRIRNGGNDGHGSWVGGTIAHNTGFAVAAEASMDNGFLFSGVHFYADNTTSNKIQSLGGGLTFVGCTIDSPFYASGTPTGLNSVIGCHFPISVVSAANAVADLSSAERLKWVFEDNYSLTGGYANDDTVVYRFADDAAAATGGLTAGRKYTNSSTNAVTIKQ